VELKGPPPEWRGPLDHNWPVPLMTLTKNGDVHERPTVQFRGLLYCSDQVFGHASQPKKSLTQNVFLLIFFLIKNFQICEHLVGLVQY
jgi:hypothetical protein